ncbi:MAG: hypothetical protein R3F59_32380 [Myxococcota bacterium]
MDLDPDDQLGYRLALAADRAHRAWSRALRDLGIHPRQFSMLALLDREPGLSQAELARRACSSRRRARARRWRASAATGCSSTRRPSPARRGPRLTAAGRALLARAVPALEAAHREVFGHLTDAEQHAT